MIMTMITLHPNPVAGPTIHPLPPPTITPPVPPPTIKQPLIRTLRAVSSAFSPVYPPT